MTAANYALLAAIVFSIVAVLQVVRAAARWPVTIGQTSIPISASWVAAAVAAILAWLGYSVHA